MKPEVVQYTTSVDSDGIYGFGDPVRWIDTRGFTFVTMYVSTLGGTSVDFRPVGTADPGASNLLPAAGAEGLSAVSFRPSGTAAYASTVSSITAGDELSVHLDPADMMPFIGFELDNMSGTVVTDVTVYLS